MFKKLFFALLLAGCSHQPQGLKVAASSVPHAEMLEFIKKDLKENLIIIVTDDYNMPNRALANQEIDANFFQHQPFLQSQIDAFHYSLQNFGAVELEPMGIYSKKHKTLPQGATIAIPNDPTNEARALLLLQKHGLIQLNDPSNLQSTILDIKENPTKIKFLEIDAAMLPRTLADVDAAAINTNYALQANLSPQDALFLEDANSPYANVLAIRKGDENRPALQELKAALNSEKMRQFILQTYKGAVKPAF